MGVSVIEKRWGMMTENSVGKQLDDQWKINRYTVVSNKFVPISCLRTCWTVWTLCKHWLQWQRGAAPHSSLWKKGLRSIPGLSMWILQLLSVCVGFPSTVHKHSHHFPLGTFDTMRSVWITGVCVLWWWPKTRARKLTRRWHNAVSCLLLYKQMKWKTFVSS